MVELISQFETIPVVGVGGGGRKLVIMLAQLGLSLATSQVSQCLAESNVIQEHIIQGEKKITLYISLYSNTILYV